MKKKILNLVFLTLLSLVIFFLFYQSNSTTKLSKRNYILVKISNKNFYPFYKPFNKGVSVEFVINMLKEVSKSPKKIYLKVKRKWEIIDINEKLFSDSLLKVKY